MYPRELLVSEEDIRKVEAISNCHFSGINDCAEALIKHDELIRQQTIEECIRALEGLKEKTDDHDGID